MTILEEKEKKNSKEEDECCEYKQHVLAYHLHEADNTKKKKNK